MLMCFSQGVTIKKKFITKCMHVIYKHNITVYFNPNTKIHAHTYSIITQFPK